MLLKILRIAIGISVLAIVGLVIYAYKHRSEMIDCEPPYFQYVASIGGKDKKYISVGLKTFSFSEISNAVIDIELPPGIQAVQGDNLQDISRHMNAFRWNVKHIDRNDIKSNAIPIVVSGITDHPIVIKFSFKLIKTQSCPGAGEEDVVFTDTIYINKAE